MRLIIQKIQDNCLQKLDHDHKTSYRFVFFAKIYVTNAIETRQFLCHIMCIVGMKF